MKTKILVTGADSQLAKTIHNISLKAVNGLEFLFVDKATLDITKTDAVGVFFAKHNFDYCVNCAAYTNVDLAETEQDQALAVNSNGVKALGIACNKYHVTLIHISTDYVFDGHKKTPYSETDLTNPINFYGESKRLGEKYIEANMTEYFIIRTSWLYSKFGKNFVKTIYNKLESGETLKIITSQKGSPTSCYDLSKFILFLIQNKTNKYGIYHFSSNTSITWYELALHIAELLNKTDNIQPIEDFNTIAKRPLYSVMDNKKAATVSNSTVNNWKESVEEVVNELLSTRIY